MKSELIFALIKLIHIFMQAELCPNNFFPKHKCSLSPPSTLLSPLDNIDLSTIRLSSTLFFAHRCSVCEIVDAWWFSMAPTSLFLTLSLFFLLCILQIWKCIMPRIISPVTCQNLFAYVSPFDLLSEMGKNKGRKTTKIGTQWM